MTADRKVNPFTDADFSLMLLSLNDLVQAVHPGTGVAVAHNHHACLRYREWLAQLEAAPFIDEFDAERYCEAETPAGPGGSLQCHVKGSPHKGDHWAIAPTICATCAGVLEHADWCPDINVVGTWGGSAEYGFDDDGRWWLIPLSVVPAQ